MTTMMAIDTSVVVALADTHDKWHAHALSIRDALLDTEIELLYFDCVINEAIGVIGRRAEEQRRSAEFDHLLDELFALIPTEAITWISGAGERLFPEITALCREHQGKLNYHDALMALTCRELGIDVIVSFDGDFDSISWLERILDSAGVSRLGIGP